MADDLSELDAAANDPALLAADADGRPAFVIDQDGELVWAGEAAFRLIAGAALDPASRRVVARMAASGAGGLLRLRIGGPAVRPIPFQARPLAAPEGFALLALEGLARAVAPAVETPEPPLAPAVEEVEAVEPVEARDIASEEGAELRDAAEAAAANEPQGAVGPDDASVEAAEEAPAPIASVAPPVEDDRPPDPRRDFDRLAIEVASQGERADAPILAETLALTEPVLAEPASSEPESAGPFEPFRFAFEIDAASRITLLSPELSRAVGPSATGAVGRTWNEVASELGLDPDGAVATALARRGGWSDIALSWPLADGRRAPLSLSALPMFDRGRTFVGFRGLGRSIGDPVAADAATADQVALENGALPAAEAPPPASEPEPAPSVDVEDQSPAAADPDATPPAPRYEPPVLVETTLPPQTFAGNVVALREAPARLDGLSSSEESAFDEIARRLQGLGLRLDGPEAFGAEDMRADASDAERFEAEDADSAELISVEDREIAAAAAPVGRDFADDQRELPFAAGADELLRLIDRLPVGALVLRGGDVAHANRAALELLGCREFGDLAGRGSDALFAEALPQDREAQAGVMRLIAANGGEVEVDARLSTIPWGGAPATLVTLRRPEAALLAARQTEQREQELSEALDIATDGVMTLDGAGRILSVNRGGEALFGFEAREVLGSLFTLSLAPESRKAAFDCLDRLKSEAGGSESIEALGLSRHGGALPLLITIGRIASAEDDRFCAVLRDIGPWKRAEEELIAARRQAERANAQKSDFLAKVGHEIRTPLNAIIGFAEVMMEERLGPIGSARYKDYLKDIHTSGGHLVKMVDDLLDITRIETGKLKLDFVAVDLNEIAQQAAALLQPQANRDRVIIRTSLARGLPPVLADRRSVRQIMANLAANAVKLSRPGGQVIVATALTDVGQAVFRVRDAGAGMSKQELARAFEPFRPLAVADNDTGFGLGLPLTRALAEANEAAFALQSEVGRGTLAEVTFPASRVLAG